MTSISLGRATLTLLITRGLGYVFALANSILLARCLGVDRLGVYAYAMGLAGLFSLLPNLGINFIIARTVAQRPEEEGGVLRVGLRAQALLAAAVTCVIPAFALLLPAQPAPLGYVGLAAAQMTLGTLAWPYLAVLGGRAQFGRIAIVELTIDGIGTTCLGAAIFLEASVPAVLVAHILASAIAVLVTRAATRPISPSNAGSSHSLLGLLRQAAPFGAVGAIQSLYGRLDILLLGQMAPHRALGLYSVAYKAPNLMVHIGSTVAGPLFPLLAQTARTENPTAFRRAVWALGVAGPALALALSGLAAPILRMLYGAEYVAAAPVLGLLAWSAAANWLYAPAAVALQARGCERRWLACLLAALALNAAGNFCMIPLWEAIGAAAATFFSEVALAGLGTVFLAREFGIIPPSRPALIGLAASLAGFAVLQLVGSGNELLGTVAALAVYFTPLLLFRVVTLEDGRLVIEWIRQMAPSAWGART